MCKEPNFHHSYLSFKKPWLHQSFSIEKIKINYLIHILIRNLFQKDDDTDQWASEVTLLLCDQNQKNQFRQIS